MRQILLVATFMFAALSTCLMLLRPPHARIHFERDVTDIKGYASKEGGSSYDPYFARENFFARISIAGLKDQ